MSFQFLYIEMNVHFVTSRDYVMHCVKNVQTRNFFWSVFTRIRTEYGEIHVFSPNTGKYRPEKPPYLDTFDAVMLL